MVRIGFRELRDRIANGVEDVTDVVAETARSFYCGIYNQTPGWVLRENVLVSPLARQVLGEMCTTEGIPPIPQPPFTGGQCSGVNYRIRAEYNYTRQFDPTTYTDGNVTFSNGLPGAITRVDYTIQGGDAFVYDIDHTDGMQNTIGNVSQANVDTILPETVVIVVERTDGQPDTCGNLPVEPENIAPPTDLDLITNYNTTLVNGDTINYDIRINRDTNNYISFPTVIDVGGVAVDFDVTGISIGEVNVNTPSGNDDSGVNKLPCNSIPVPVDLGDQEPVDDSTDEADVEKLVAVIVRITQVPVSEGIYSGYGAPDIIYPGWVEFKQGEDYYPRQFINFEKNYFPAPEGATGYAVTVKPGYTATIAKVTEQEG